MEFVKDNREMLILSVVVIGLLVMASAIGYDYRGGQPWAY